MGIHLYVGFSYIYLNIMNNMIYFNGSYSTYLIVRIAARPCSLVVTYIRGIMSVII